MVFYGFDNYVFVWRVYEFWVLVFESRREVKGIARELGLEDDGLLRSCLC